MNINPLLIKLKEVTGLSVSPDVYRGSEEEYITFNYADERDILFADDKPIVEKADMQVHLFVLETTNYMDYKKKIKNYLLKIGACGISCSCIYENDTKKKHVIFEFEISEGRS